MSNLTLTKIRFRNGTWEGRISSQASTARPDIQVLYQDQPVASTSLTEGETSHEWDLRIPVPPQAVADGVQTFLITTANGETLGAFTLTAGDDDNGSLRAEVELLRAELDMLKRAFRRHCLETM